eukprot:4574766-Alexandrium_andersonii.AAC.1
MSDSHIMLSGHPWGMEALRRKGEPTPSPRVLWVRRARMNLNQADRSLRGAPALAPTNMMASRLS